MKKLLLLITVILLIGCAQEENPCDAIFVYDYNGRLETETGYHILEEGVIIETVYTDSLGNDSVGYIHWYQNGVTGECERDSMKIEY